MTLKEQFENAGNWLFKWRSYLPLIVLGVVLLAMREYTRPGGNEIVENIWEFFCLIISFSGLAIRVLVVGYVPKNTSGRNTKKQVADVLNTSGAYSVVRNPLYLGNFVMGLGVVLFACFWWLVLLYLLSFWLYYERIIFAEEAYLSNKFGDEYKQWANLTPAIIPNFRLYKKSDLPFSLKNVLRREYNGFFAVIAALFLLELVGDMFMSGNLFVCVDAEWKILLCCGFVVWFFLRMLKKHTTILDVKGR